jgi:hypothetical protein
MLRLLNRKLEQKLRKQFDAQWAELIDNMCNGETEPDYKAEELRIMDELGMHIETPLFYNCAAGEVLDECPILLLINTGTLERYVASIAP